jgi:hypothetical protein
VGVVLPFLTRAELGGDWTASERERLAELAERLSAGGARVSTVFGASDSGEPWCVVTDETGEVLVHVARIGGRFIVHEAARDTIGQGDSLWGALGRMLGQAWQAPSGVVVSLRSREAQSLLALLTAVTFFYETRQMTWRGDAAAGLATWPHAAPHGDSGPDLAPAAPPRHDEAPAPDKAADDAPAHAAVDPAAAAAPPAPAGLAPPPAEPGHDQAAAPAPPPPAGPGDPAHAEPQRILLGGPGAETLHGGPGDDLLDGRGAPAGSFNRLDGAGGDDHIVLRPNTVASGGPGADTFAVAAPAAASSGAAPAIPVALGVVLDFTVAEGDTLQLPAAGAVVLSQTDVADVTTVAALPAGVAGPTPGVRVGVDFDDDGHEDGYLLLGGAAAGQVAVSHAPAPAEADPPTPQAHPDTGADWLL